MDFQELAHVLVDLEQTSSRNLMTEIIADYLKRVDEKTMPFAVYLLLGHLGPLYERIDFGLADKMVARAIALAAGEEEQEVIKRFRTCGDWGEVAMMTKITQTDGQAVSVVDVFDRLVAIARESGKGSQDKKIHLAARLLQRLTPVERKYVVRMILGKMRLGFSDKTILDALVAMDGQHGSNAKKLEQLYQLRPDIGAIARIVKQYGCAQAAAHVAPRLGTPIMPALAQRLKSADEMIAKMGKVFVEPKFDGQRIQIHFKRGELVKSYARSLEENAAMFPELKDIDSQIMADSVILDCEAVGYDPDTGKMRPFQETITRKRKHGVEAVSKTIPIRFNCFDLLYLNGESLIDRPLFERRALLEKVIRRGTVLQVDDCMVTESAEALRTYHKQQLELGLEGVMVKQYDGAYQPGRTGWNWVKFKEMETAAGKLADTIDGIVMGYYRGRGKRSALGIGAFLLGILDETTQQYVTVAKIGTGLSDEQWQEMKRRVDSIFSLIQPSAYVVAPGLIPDVWADPYLVVEIAADEVTVSPLHSSGFGLRFPRLVRFREDKRAEQVTTVAELRQLRG